MKIFTDTNNSRLYAKLDKYPDTLFILAEYEKEQQEVIFIGDKKFRETMAIAKTNNLKSKVCYLRSIDGNYHAILLLMKCAFKLISSLPEIELNLALQEDADSSLQKKFKEEIFEKDLVGLEKYLESRINDLKYIIYLKNERKRLHEKEKKTLLAISETEKSIYETETTTSTSPIKKRPCSFCHIL